MPITATGDPDADRLLNSLYKPIVAMAATSS